MRHGTIFQTLENLKNISTMDYIWPGPVVRDWLSTLTPYLEVLFPKMHLRTALKLLAVGGLIGTSSAECPDYTTFSQKPQGNPSKGPLQLPFMRPSPQCRTFNSTAVEVWIIKLALHVT
jgi:hypothetical protein